MGTVSITTALIIVIGWITLIEYDSYSESEKSQIMQKIKTSPLYIMVIALMPIGILLNIVGNVVLSSTIILLGSTLIFVQGLIVAFLFWNRKRWKSVLLFVVTIGLGIFLYIPLFIM